MNNQGVWFHGRVLKVTGLRCQVHVGEETWQCNLRGRLRRPDRQAGPAVVAGDWVEITRLRAGCGVVEGIKPRKSRLSRVANGSRAVEQVFAANLDQIVVVASLEEPPLSPGFIDRAIIVAVKGGIVPAICLNKTDLTEKNRIESVGKVYADIGFDVCYTSVQNGEGLGDFVRLLDGKISAVVGQSGAGKSSLLNSINPSLNIRTGSLTRRHKRGRHTTTVVQLYPLGRTRTGYVADCPGLKELQPWSVKVAEVATYYREMTPFLGHCQFRDCSHLHEPGCAVRAAVDKGDINSLRYDGYRRIMESLL